jgi:hypothetical protein
VHALAKLHDGAAAWNAGELQLAAHYFLSAYVAEPSKEAALDLVLAYHRMGQYAEARWVFRHLLTSSPNRSLRAVAESHVLELSNSPLIERGLSCEAARNHEQDVRLAGVLVDP